MVRDRRTEKTPKDLVDKLNSKINAGLADAELKKARGSGDIPMSVTPDEFSKFINDETEKWAKVVKFSGAKVE